MELREIIRANNDKWNTAFNSGDAAALAALYTADATVLPHTHDIVRGAEKIRDFWKSVIDAGFERHVIELIDVHAQEGLAVEIATWRAEGPGEGGKQAFGGSLVNVFERQNDGSWKCRLHIWN